MTYLEKLKKLNTHRNENEWAERICSELIYLDGVSELHGNRFDADIEKAIDFLFGSIKEYGSITRQSTLDAESMLSHLSAVAKSYRALFVAHAHIDMNWMWGYNETATVTVDTFQTILNLMREYPDFTYAQSQASVYEIIENYAPHMLDEIRMRVHEGRWEITAAEWVEPDKNMPNGESLTRQILQSKKYLSSLLEIPADSICIDFVPDTFGHNAQVPEILSNAGIKYMYHCRGKEMDGINVYRFVSPSGKKTLNYREYTWYNGKITTEKFEIVPNFCRDNKVNTYLCVYGVGDHGGGPSRRDIERILKYRSWPLTPDISFGTFRTFFEAMEESGVDFPEFKEEFNCLFTGCYTTQARIKMANRISEARINETEALTAMDSLLTGAPRHQQTLDRAWRNILFNHFHDILPGSGTIETREYALGRFQDTLAATSTFANQAMRSISQQIDTTKIAFDDAEETISEGGGVGYYQSQGTGFRMPSTERGRGTVRAIHVFNPTAYEREEFTELILWDYPCEDLITAEDVNGNPLEFYVLERAGKGYWQHIFIKLLVKVKVAPFGYTTVVFRPKTESGHYEFRLRKYELSDEHINDAPLVLENELIRATFDHSTLELTELYDKTTNETLINTPACTLELIQENQIFAMTSWRVGPYMSQTNLNRNHNVRFTGMTQNDAFSRFTFEVRFEHSVAQTTVTLKKGSPVLEYDFCIDWNELPVKKVNTPQLRFAMPVSYKTNGKCVYDIPYGEIERPQIAHDVPALSYMGIDGDTSHILGIVTDTKYGFRCDKDTGSVTLLRSADHPDPYSDRGIHHIKIGVACTEKSALKEISDRFNHPLCFTSATCHKGDLPAQGSTLSISGNVIVSCFKNAEDNTGAVIRLYNATDAEQSTMLSLIQEISDATLTDSNENPIRSLSHEKNAVCIDVPAYEVVTIKLGFRHSKG